jgi:hypothetical protein
MCNRMTSSALCYTNFVWWQNRIFRILSFSFIAFFIISCRLDGGFLVCSYLESIAFILKFLVHFGFWSIVCLRLPLLGSGERRWSTLVFFFFFFVGQTVCPIFSNAPHSIDSPFSVSASTKTNVKITSRPLTFRRRPSSFCIAKHDPFDRKPHHKNYS